MSISDIKKIQYRPEIDGLRAVAVIAVIINHFNKDFLESGYLGVDIFFVISGYVITSSLTKRKSKNFFEFIVSFYERRIKRLVPALLFFVLFTCLWIWLVYPDPTILIRTGISSLFGLSNIYLFKRSTDYFAESTLLNPFTHTWSLSVEEQFYFIFPILFWFSGYGNNKKNGINNFFNIVLSLTILSLFSFVYLYSKNESAAYFLMPMRFWEISMGCLTYLLLNRSYDFLKTFRRFSPSLLFVFIILIFLLPSSFPVSKTILIVLITSIMLTCLRENTFCFKLFSKPFLVNLGLMSYSLYLWHWGILSLSRWTIGITWWSIPIQIVLIYYAAKLSYNFIENPIRNKSFSKNYFLNIFIGLITLISSGALLSGINKLLNGKLYFGRFESIQFKYIQSELSCERFSPNYNSNPIKCLTKSKNGNVIWLFGNSHASNLVNSLELIKKQFGFEEVLYYTNPEELWMKNKAFEIFLQQINSGDLIIFSYRNINVDINGPFNANRMQNEIEEFIKIANNLNVKLILVDDAPNFNYFNFLPQFTFFRNGPKISKNSAIKKRQEHTMILQKYVDNKKVFYVDQFDILCDSDNCPAVMNKKLIYADNSPHFNKNGAILIKQLWINQLPKIINKNNLE